MNYLLESAQMKDKENKQSAIENSSFLFSRQLGR